MPQNISHPIVCAATKRHGHLYAMNGKTGEIIWTSENWEQSSNDTKSQLGGTKPQLGVGIQPTLLSMDDDYLYVRNRSSDPYLCCRSIHSGELIWYTKMGDAASYVTSTEDVLYYITYSDDVYALSTDSGHTCWKYNSSHTSDDDIWGSASVNNGLVFVPRSGHILVIRKGHGTVCNSINIPGDPQTDPLISDGILYIGLRKKGVAAFDLSNAGSTQTPATNSDTESPTNGRLWLNDSVKPPQTQLEFSQKTRIICGANSHNRTVFGLDADDGSQCWSQSYSGEGGVTQHPIVINDTVYVATATTIYALDIETGNERWAVKHNSEYAPSLLRLEDTLCIKLKFDGYIQLVPLNIDTGKQLWSLQRGEPLSYPKDTEKIPRTKFITRKAPVRV